MRIAVDAMGGDHAPEVVVEGAVAASAEPGIEVCLVGDSKKINELLDRLKARRSSISVIHASQVVPMGAHPIDAVRKMKDSSIVMAAQLVRDDKADAMVSAGSTGAAMAAATLILGRIKGIERPAIGSVIPTLKGACVLVDAGANVDCRTSHLVQFAVMGSVYAERVLGARNPKVALLNIGEEETKGCELVLEAYDRLRSWPGINFIGNIEGKDILAGEADVVVCDGFVGNVALKLAEGLAEVFFRLLRTEMTRTIRSRLGALLLRPGLLQIRRRLDYTEYGGAPLLGVRGVCVISHGRSNAKAMRSAIRVAGESAGQGVIAAIEARVKTTSGLKAGEPDPKERGEERLSPLVETGGQEP